jgi:hypothetical protein
MAKTGAERQRAYRTTRQFAGKDGNGERRLNTWVSTRAALALDCLAVSYGVTKRELLERLLVAEEEQVLQGLALIVLKVKSTLRANGYAVTNI